MPLPSRPILSLCLAGLLAASGCVGAGPVAPTTPKPPKKPATARPSASPAPTAAGKDGIAAQLAALSSLEKLAVPQAGQAATLTGKVKLISDRGGALISDNGGAIISDNGGGIVSDNGGGIISNNGGTIVSDNGGGLVSNNGGGLIANNGGGLTAKAKYGLAQAKAQAATGPALFALADAVVTLHDARGRLLTTDAGEPIVATTGKDGAYTLEATLPPGNLVAKIRLWNGGELMAMVARDGAGQLTLDLDTASTMGAAYVLGQFVKGDQATFDKLPRSENERLTRELDAVRGYVTGAFKYDAKLLTEATDALRARVPAVDKTIEDVKALLVGQANLGGGRPATEVAIADPVGITVRRSGDVLIAESFTGRVRAVDPAGKLTTLVDAAFGRFQVNYPTLGDVVEAPDGTLYICAFRSGRVFRLSPDGRAEPFAGTGALAPGAIGAAMETPMAPRALALGPDGTLYVGERRPDGAENKQNVPRLLAVKDGRVTQVPADWGPGNIQGLALGPDGAIYALHQRANGGRGKLLALRQGTLTTIAADLGCEDDGDLVRGADGTLYVAEDLDGRVTAFAPDGTKRVLTGADAAEPGARDVLVPCGLGVGPDGTLYVADLTTSLIHARTPAGVWRVFAGTQAAQQQGDVTAFAISLPGGAAIGDQDDLYVAEGGSHTIKRFRDGRLEVFAGTLRGEAGDGGPAAAARFDSPGGIAMHAGALWVLDSGNRALRRIAPDGTVTRVAGGNFGKDVLLPGEARPAADLDLSGGMGLKLTPDGMPYWTNQESGQVARLRQGPDGPVAEAVAGRGNAEGPGTLDFGAIIAATLDPDPLKAALSFPFGMAFDAAGDLYVADAPACQILKVRKPGTPEARIEPWVGLALGEVLARAAELGPDGKPVDDGGKDRRAVGAIVPTGVAFDAAGTMYYAEAGTLNLAAFATVFGGRFPIDPALLPQAPPRVRKVTPDGVVTTIAGPGGKFFTDPKAEGALALPTAVEIDRAGRLVIIDSGANLIRILPAGSY